jgi:hypothetical protein
MTDSATGSDAAFSETHSTTKLGDAPPLMSLSLMKNSAEASGSILIGDLSICRTRRPLESW